ncbi:MAG: D-amino-acid transaminase [Parvularculaceae bacterium]|nr:D-amino-acid transaminase [Parvularculaceae bacterium]
MPRIAYVNGRYLPIREATVSIEDRGYQFADGVYEVLMVVDGRVWDEEGHMTRLARSLRELRIDAPMREASLRAVVRQVLRRNRLSNALVYMQVTRGVFPRNHAFPTSPVPPALVVTAKPWSLDKANAAAAKGVHLLSRPDIRWGRVDIKTIGLLPNCLAKQAAVEAGAQEALLVRDGYVTEGASTNAWIVDANGDLVTRPLGDDILGGITRKTLIACAEALQMKVVERPFTLDEVANAREAFISAATLFATPAISIDGKNIGDGRPGPIVRRLRETYIAQASALARTA